MKREKTRSLALVFIIALVISSCSYWGANTYGMDLTEHQSSTATILTRIDAQAAITRDNKPPGIPAGLAAVPGNQCITMSWLANPEADLNGYQLQYKDALAKWSDVFIGPNITEYMINDLNNGTEYQFRIRATDLAGNWSRWSDTVYTAPLGEPVAVTGVTLDQTALELSAGGATVTLVATVSPADATEKRVNWASSDSSVATVAGGIVTPITAGTAIITVTTVDGNMTAACTVSVGTAAQPLAKVLFTFDDGYKEHITVAAPILAAKGFAGTAYVFQNNVLYLSDRTMNTADLDSLYNDYGWDIGNHTVSHPHGTGTDPAALETLRYEYLTNQEWLALNGWTRGAYHAAYPYGDYSSELIEILKEIGCESARLAGGGLQPLPVSNFYLLRTQEVGGRYYNARLTKTQIDNAVQSSSTLILFFHYINDTTKDYTISPADFQAIVDYVDAYAAAGKIEVTTISRWYDELNG